MAAFRETVVSGKLNSLNIKGHLGDYIHKMKR